MPWADQIERFSKAPIQHKVAALVVISVVLAAGFYFSLYSDVDNEIRRLGGQVVALQRQVASYEDKKQKYMSFRAEVNKLLEEQKELVKVLPADAEIPSFLEGLHAQAELAGLNIVTFQPGAEQRQNFYARIPVRMAISGTYHQISKFFHAVGQLKRIVNIQGVSLVNPVVNERGVFLKATFSVNTFRFIAPRGPGGPPPRRGGPPPRRGA